MGLGKKLKKVAKKAQKVSAQVAKVSDKVAEVANSPLADAVFQAVPMGQQMQQGLTAQAGLISSQANFIAGKASLSKTLINQFSGGLKSSVKSGSVIDSVTDLFYPGVSSGVSGSQKKLSFIDMILSLFRR